VTVKKVRQHREAAVWKPLMQLFDQFAKGQGMTPDLNRQWNALPPAMSLRPTQFGGKYGDESFIRGGKNNRMVGIRMTVPALLVHTFDIGRMRIVNREGLPPGKYDFFVSVPNRSAAMQAEIKRQLGLVLEKQRIETNVLLLTVARPDAPALKPLPEGAPRAKPPKQAGHWKSDNMDAVRQFAEIRLKMPVLDATGLTNKYNIDFLWNEKEQETDADALKQALLDQLGLQLVPTNQVIDMIVWKK
jgi:uncharacterized protein (TIGR03435 family)